jgi:hypothetical protein
MLPIELGYGLMIAGALLVVAGVVGLALRRKKEDEAEPVALPGDAPWKGLRSNSAEEQDWLDGQLPPHK